MCCFCSESLSLFDPAHLRSSLSLMAGCLGGIGEKRLGAVWVNADDVCHMFLKHNYSHVHMRNLGHDCVVFDKRVFCTIRITDVCVCPIIKDPVFSFFFSFSFLCIFPHRRRLILMATGKQEKLMSVLVFITVNTDRS